MGEVTEQAIENANNRSTANMAQIVYILYLASLILGITQIVGVIIAYINKSDAPEWVRSHFQFQIRTFWMGILYSVIGLATMYILIGFAILFAALVWFIIRCVKGLKYHSKQQPVPNPKTWFI
jgi:uncharacterized membrane protein